MEASRGCLTKFIENDTACIFVPGKGLARATVGIVNLVGGVFLKYIVPNDWDENDVDEMITYGVKYLKKGTAQLAIRSVVLSVASYPVVMYLYEHSNYK